MPPPLRQRRLRIEVYLPNRTRRQKKAFARVVNHIKTQRQEALGITGFTQVDDHLGTWWDDEFDWVEDRISIISIDVIGDEQNKKFMTEVANLKRYILAAYEACNAYQKDIWLVTYPLNCYVRL